MLEQVEQFRQRQASIMGRFAQAQARIARVEERLQALHNRRNAAQFAQNQEQVIEGEPEPTAFLPSSGDLELMPGFADPQAEEQEPTDRLALPEQS